MPIHDWTRVPAGTYHDFHSSWIIHLKEMLNDGPLPKGFYALAEQHAGQVLADVLTLQHGNRGELIAGESGPIAVADAPPRVRRKVVASEMAACRLTRRTLTIRHISGHRVVALLEITSPANKDRELSVAEFVQKAHGALSQHCHLLVVDLFPPGRHDPLGLCGAIWEQFDDTHEPAPPDKPLSMAAFIARRPPEAYIEPIAVGDVLPDMPLFLDLDWYVNTPLETAYNTAYRGVPSFWRDVVEGQLPNPSG